MWQGLVVYFALVALRVLLNYRALRNYLKLPLIERPAEARQLPSVSIVIPARNEERSLPLLLSSLSRLEYSGEIKTIVVDDGSTDWTAGIATEHGASVIRVSEPEEGWTGKAFACWTGAREAIGHWLLFTDADTLHEPGSLDKAMRFALERRLQAVSMLLQQRCVSFGERALVPYVSQQAFISLPYQRVNQPGDPDALGNGQYMLVEREAYFRAGGHRAVKGAIADGLALAQQLKKAGVALAIARGERLASVGANESLAHMHAGLARNVAAFLRQRGSHAWLTVVGSILSALAIPCLLYGLLTLSPAFILAALVTYATAAVELMLWQVLFEAGIGYALYQPVAALLFLGIIVEGGIRRKHPWKGRLPA